MNEIIEDLQEDRDMYMRLSERCRAEVERLQQVVIDLSNDLEILRGQLNRMGNALNTQGLKMFCLYGAEPDADVKELLREWRGEAET